LLNVRLVSWFVLPTAVQLRTRPSLTTVKTDYVMQRDSDCW